MIHITCMYANNLRQMQPKPDRADCEMFQRMLHHWKGCRLFALANQMTLVREPLARTLVRFAGIQVRWSYDDAFLFQSMHPYQLRNNGTECPQSLSQRRRASEVLSKPRSSRGNEAQTGRNPRKMEPPHVGCYSFGKALTSPSPPAAGA